MRDCLFRDVGGAAYQLGRWDSADEAGASRQERDNTLLNSLVADVGAEYRGAAAVQVFYDAPTYPYPPPLPLTLALALAVALALTLTLSLSLALTQVFYAARTLIAHNAIVRSPYSAISVGWGWGRASYAASNTVEANRVHRYKLKLDDGGCLYTLSDQPGSAVRRNWCSGQLTAKGGALYPDEGSAHMRWYENVLERLGGSRWVQHIWNSNPTLSLTSTVSLSLSLSLTLTLISTRTRTPTPTPTRWVHIWNSNASQGAICSELSVSGNFHDTPTLVNSGANISMRANRLVEPRSAWPPQARAVMAEAGPVDSPWRGSAAWLALGFDDAEAAAAAASPLPLHAGGAAPSAAPPSGQRQAVESRTPRPAAASRRAVADDDDDDDDAWCRRAKREQGVTPGSSWGRLTKAGEAEWMRRRCDRFFCQPHAMESQGVYKCVPVVPAI